MDDSTVRKHKKRTRRINPQLILQKLTLRDRAVYYMLVGGDCFYTQSSVCDRLGLAKSTVSNITRRLLDSKAIFKYREDRHNIIYRKGINHSIVDEHVKIDLDTGGYRKILNYQVDTPISIKQPHEAIFRAHLSKGGWIDITVLQEGKIDSFEQNGQVMILFGETSPTTRMRGLLKWDGKILTDTGWMPIRYIKGINTGTMTFGISPNGILIKGRDLKASHPQILEMFYSVIKPIFDSMERFGSWKFKKDSDGNYLFRSKAEPEYGADAYVTSIMTGLRGTDFGFPGRTEDWYDRSPAAGADGEYETSNPDLAQAISSLPETHSMVLSHNTGIKALDNRVANLEHRVKTIENTITKEEEE